ncbi:hypothetical protein HIM_00421 [Hirsutella minnesotensis 3608]|nr:hypothetical protein HIM_00421 [Hirsutella minnesotensis 3608]
MARAGTFFELPSPSLSPHQCRAVSLPNLPYNGMKSLSEAHSVVQSRDESGRTQSQDVRQDEVKSDNSNDGENDGEDIDTDNDDCDVKSNAEDDHKADSNVNINGETDGENNEKGDNKGDDKIDHRNDNTGHDKANTNDSEGDDEQGDRDDNENGNYNKDGVHNEGDESHGADEILERSTDPNIGMNDRLEEQQRNDILPSIERDDEPNATSSVTQSPLDLSKVDIKFDFGQRKGSEYASTTSSQLNGGILDEFDLDHLHRRMISENDDQGDNGPKNDGLRAKRSRNCDPVAHRHRTIVSPPRNRDAVDNQKGIRASTPRIPDPYDDNMDTDDSLVLETRKIAKKKKTKNKNGDKKQREKSKKKASKPPTGRRTSRSKKVNQESAQRKGHTNTKPKENTIIPQTEQLILPRPKGFLILPPEVRRLVYRELLVATQPIIVHGNWQLVYRRHSRLSGSKRPPKLHPAVLRCSGVIYHEARCVLYGENTFLYRLRDAAPSVVDVARLAEDDGEDQFEVENDEDDASDWEVEQRMQRSKRRRGLARGGRKKMVRPDIFVQKHLGLFRHIGVEAEHNRFSQSTMRSMAKAIRVFAPRSGSAVVQPNIQTLIVRVSPLRIDADQLFIPGINGQANASLTLEEQEEAEERRRRPHFTFVDFFAGESPVHRAILELECRTLHIDLMTRYMKGPEGLVMHRRRRLVYDRGAEVVARRALRDSGQLYLRDPAAVHGRRRKADKVAERLAGLGADVHNFCCDYINGKAGPWDSFAWLVCENDDYDETP